MSCESNNRMKNLLGVLLSIIVLMLISSLIVASIVILNPEIVSLTGKQYASREAITLEEAMLGELGGNSFTYQWLSWPPLADRDEPEQLFDELLFEDAKNLNTISIGSPSGPSAKREPIGNGTTANSNHRLSPQTSDNLQQRPLARAAKLTTLISNSSLLSSIEYQGFKLSPSKRFLLIWTSKRKQFRHTFTARYFIYDIKQDLITMLNTRRSLVSTGFNYANAFENLDSASQYLGGQQNDNDELARFQLVDWFPQLDGKQQIVDSLIMVQNNDLYLLRDVASNAASDAASGLNRLLWPFRLTFDGKQDEIFNGVPDWLYEEEILADAPAYQVSPKSTSLAYMSFNDSQVEMMSFHHYGPLGNVIPSLQRIRYPKAGRVNPRVSVHVIDGLRGADELAANYPALVLPDVKLQLPDNLSERQHYINRIRWLTDDKLALVWLNRHQNESYVVVCTRQTNWQCEKNLHLTAANGWLDMTDDLTPLDEDHYLALLFKDEGSAVGSFKHVAKISINQSNSYTFLTGGRREVLSVNGIDRKRSALYYTATQENEPGQRQLFWASLEESNKEASDGPAQCLTCDHHPEECLYNFVKMSPSTSYYIFECDGPGVPRIELRLTRLPLAAGADKRQIFPPAPLMEGTSGAGLAQQQQQHLSSGQRDKHFESRPEANNNGSEMPISGKSQIDNNNASLYQEPPPSSLLWTIEDNQALRAKLTYGKGMPLTMRLKVPIPNTNYSANVLMLLPPQIGFRSTFGRVPLTSAGNALGNGQTRSPRDAAAASSVSPGGGGQVSGAGGSQATASTIRQPVHAFYTPSSIADYTSQLTAGQQFPMVVDVYGGPGSQRVDYRYHIGFGHYLASSRRTIYVMIDGRGSGYQGTKRLYELYHRLGSVEIEDQIEVTAYLTRNFSFIDPSKVAIWGWSYGGYAAAMALARSNALATKALQAQLRSSNMSSSPSPFSSPSTVADTLTRPLPFYLAAGHPHPKTLLPLGGVFECAASVAPVTNWIYYDTAYTERYMSAPYLNEQYDESSLGDHETNDNKRALQQQQQQPDVSKLPNKDSRSSIGFKWLPLNQTTVIDSTYLRPPTSSSSASPSSLAELMQRAAGRSNAAAAGSSTDQARHQPYLNERYRNASLIEHIASIDRKRFLLIHGTADDNVHFQQSIMLMKRLIQKNVMFETRIYPDQDHGIANKADKLHLAATLSNFFAECFDMA